MDDDSPVPAYAELHSLLDELGWTNVRLARETGYHQQSVSRWVTGRHRVPLPVLDMLRRKVARRRRDRARYVREKCDA